VLYLSHNGMTEPLGRRQVLPYLVGLSGRGWRFTVISFEKPWTALPDAMARVEEIASASGIVWRPLRYHHRPPLISTAYDIVHGWKEGRLLGRGAALIHARSTVPALMAQMISGGLGAPWVFDLRGLLAEEYVDAGHWRPGGLRHRVTSWAERRLLRSADGVVTLTEAILERLPGAAGLRRDRPATVIPCSVDLEVFQPSPAWRREVRNEFGWKDEPVLVYSGSLGSWYRLEEMLDFFETARQQLVGLRFLVLTPHAPAATDVVRARALTGSVSVLSLPPDAVPRHLAAGDAGICFLGPHASKVASSPTKYGEYLAAGLPVLTNSGTGDARALATEPAWILIDSFAEDQYQHAAARLARLLATPEASRTAARGLARRHFAIDTAIDRYEQLYQTVLGR
jgi:glycosyltransferase involved in cell wall biosynthesis